MATWTWKRFVGKYEGRAPGAKVVLVVTKNSAGRWVAEMLDAGGVGAVLWTCAPRSTLAKAKLAAENNAIQRTTHVTRDTGPTRTYAEVIRDADRFARASAEKIVDAVGEALGVDTGTCSRDRFDAAVEAVLRMGLPS